MTSQGELKELIAMAEERGATIVCTHDQVAKIVEGRDLIDTVQVHGMKGCGPHPMTAIYAAERLRELLL